MAFWNDSTVSDSGMSVSFQSGSAGSAGTVSQESSPQQQQLLALRAATAGAPRPRKLSATNMSTNLWAGPPGTRITWCSADRQPQELIFVIPILCSQPALWLSRTASRPGQDNIVWWLVSSSGNLTAWPDDQLSDLVISFKFWSLTAWSGEQQSDLVISFKMWSLTARYDDQLSDLVISV